MIFELIFRNCEALCNLFILKNKRTIVQNYTQKMNKRYIKK